MNLNLQNNILIAMNSSLDLSNVIVVVVVVDDLGIRRSLCTVTLQLNAHSYLNLCTRQAQ